MLVVIRLFLGVTFLFYGVVKVAGGQFQYDDFVIDSRTVDGPTLVWTFYGYSAVYGRLIGLAEMLAGGLLLMPRTRTLGALLVFPIAANITVLDFCFGFPEVKYFALFLTVLDTGLLWAERQKLRRLFQLAMRAEPGAETRMPLRRVEARYVAWAAASLLTGFFLLNALLAALDAPASAAANYCAGQGWKRDDLQLLRWQMTSGASGLDRRGAVDFQVRGTEPARVLHVGVRKLHSFTDWQITDYTDSGKPTP